MAIINVGPDYTHTGKERVRGVNTGKDRFLTKLANWSSFVPVIGGFGVAFFGYLDTAIDAVGWLLKGKPLSALTVGAAGAVSTSVNAVATGSGVGWWLNAGSGIVSGRSVGTHTRALTEGAIGAVTGALGMKPEVLRSHVAGMGTAPGMAQSRPGQFATAEANRRGQDANQMWNNYQAGNGQDYEALMAAQRAQAAQAGRA